MVGEHSKRAEVSPARGDGALGRENAGMSNRKSGENPDGRKPKVSVAMEISHGLGGPKVIPAFGQGQPMGKPVNIPAPRYLPDGVTERSRPGPLLDLGCHLEDGWEANPPPGRFLPTSKRWQDSRLLALRIWLSTLPRKASRDKGIETVPQTDTGGLVSEYQGQRVSPGQGTRQTSGRNFGIRPTNGGGR